MGVSDGLADFRVSEIAAPARELPALDVDSLLKQARAHRPELLMGAALVERAQARAELEKALSKPDWTVSLGYKRTAGFNTILAGVAVPLPLFNKNEGNILFSRQEVGREEHLLQETAAQAAADIAGAVAGIQRRRAMLADMQKGIMQQAEESLRISLAAYQEGGSDLLRLLDAQRVRNEVQLLYSRTQMEYLISLAELESAVGEEVFLPLEEVERENP
jgi:cobalt-zinc-cadmium efflux system outer membrane protein